MVAARQRYRRTGAVAKEILEAVWPYLKPGGTLVYATCSIMPEENQQQVAGFLERHADATLVGTGSPQRPGIQKLPSPDDGDGFFYAKLVKTDIASSIV